MKWFDNLKWSDWVYYIDGWIPKASLSMPIFGYLILFNDGTTNHLINFTNLTTENEINFSLSDNARLKMIYFAFLFLGVSNFWYRITRPYQFKFGTDFVQYAKNTFEIFTKRKYVEIRTDLQQHGSSIINENRYTTDWDRFQKELIANSNQVGNDSNAGNWELTKNKYGNMLRSILEEYYFLSNTSCRGHLLFCVIFSSIGYALLLIPSVDLLIKVLRATF